MAISDEEKRAAIQLLFRQTDVENVLDRVRPEACSAKPAPGVAFDGSSAAVLRVIRETGSGRRVKALHNFRCQICGIRLEGDAGPYAEAAHIRPVTQPHDGPDKLSNLLCLCPNHRVLFEAGRFAIGNDFSLLGLGGKLRLVKGHPVSIAHLTYHRRLWVRN